MTPRLLMVTSVPETLSFLTPIAGHFRAEGWRVDALTGAQDGHGEQRAAFDEVHAAGWGRDPRDLLGLARGFRAARELVAERGYDIVHVHTPIAAFVTRLALRHRERKRGPIVVYTAHGFHFHAGGRRAANALFLAAERLAGRWTDYLVVMNRVDEAAALERGIVAPHRVRRMPGIGVDLDAYAPEGVDPAQIASLRRALGLGDDPALLCAAEFTPRKRHRDLLVAFAAVAAEGEPRPHLLLAGRGPLEEEVRAQARHLGLGDRVHFLGLRRDVPLLMRAAAALVLPSEREGLPRCVLEAMAMGLPVVGSRIRGTEELLEGGCGWLYEVGDTQALSASLRSVLRDASTAAVMARRARKRVARYDVRNVIRLHADLYAEALGAPRAETSAARQRRSIAVSPVSVARGLVPRLGASSRAQGAALQDHVERPAP